MDAFDPALEAPFSVTRSSHVRLAVRDVEASVEFYTDLAGLIVTEREAGAVYLRGIEEACHHSLVLRPAREEPSCDAIGFRVFHENDLAKAAAFFSQRGASTKRVAQPHQGETLLVTGPFGIPLEFCARMTTAPRQIADYREHRGGKCLRLNHYQVVLPHVGDASADFSAMGFRTSEYIENPETGERMGTFLHRKNDPHDLVLARGPGPRLHHFAYVTHNLQNMIQACDVAAAMGIGREVERGPGRHGPGNGMFVYFRDPDGHRMEIILPPMQLMDIEEEPKRWLSTQSKQIVPWGPRAPQRWIEEASSFTGLAVTSGGASGRWTAS